MFGFEWGWQQGTATVVARRLIKEWRSAHDEPGSAPPARKDE